MKLQTKILFVLLIASSICFGQNTISSDEIFQEIVGNPKTELDKKTYSDGIMKEFYELKNHRNEWIAFNEFHPQGKIKEQGVYLNGYNFGVWKEYDSKGVIISQIDYSIPKQIVGPNQTHLNKFTEAKEIGDSIIKSHFDSTFAKSIRLNAPRSYWYTENNSGSWFEKASKIPNEFTLRYSIIIQDSLYFTPIEIRIENKQVQSLKGTPSTESFKFQIDYQKALEIAELKGYGQIHKTAFKDSEFMTLAFKDDIYYWTISRIAEDKWKGYPNSNSGTITANGRTLYINSLTGKTTESDFGGIINVCD
ncbi:MAG: hypothetical protein ACI8XB_001429 [Patiriisocius sp.]|jgi:hypothetical protein